MKKHAVALLAFDGMEAFELGCALEIFGIVRPGLENIWYDFFVCSASCEPLLTNAGVMVIAPYGLDKLASADTLIIPNWPTGRPPPRDIAEAVLGAFHRGARVASICSGAFLLAALGILDGRRVTTHWLFADELARRFPKVRVEPDVLYIDEGQVVTSAGTGAGIDMLLHLIRRDHGSRVCNMVARRMVMPPHRNGGQSQFVTRPVQPQADSRFNAVVEHMRNNLAQRLPLPELARMAALSERSFFRRFRECFGMPPGEWLIRERIEVAKEMLEQGGVAIEQLAATLGFGASATFRQHFRKVVGTSPADYRRTFGPRGSASSG